MQTSGCPALKEAGHVVPSQHLTCPRGPAGQAGATCPDSVDLRAGSRVAHGLGARGQSLPLSNPQDLLSTEPGAFVRLLETARPTPVSSGDKARILSALPETGEITNLNAQALHKLAALSRVLRATDSVYVIKVFAVPQAAVALYARTVLLISEAALTLLSADELQAVVAHEIGHRTSGWNMNVPSGSPT